MRKAVIKTCHDLTFEAKNIKKDAAAKLGIIPQKFSRWIKMGVIFVDGEAYMRVK